MNVIPIILGYNTLSSPINTDLSGVHTAYVNMRSMNVALV